MRFIDPNLKVYLDYIDLLGVLILGPGKRAFFRLHGKLAEQSLSGGTATPRDFLLDVLEKFLDLQQFFWHWKLGKPLVGWFFRGTLRRMVILQQPMRTW